MSPTSPICDRLSSVSGRAILRLRAGLSAGSGVAGIRLRKIEAATLTRKNAVGVLRRTETTLPNEIRRENFSVRQPDFVQCIDGH